MSSFWGRHGYALLGLALLTFVAFAPAYFADFVNFDDNEYVCENGIVQAGLTLEGWKWAWTTTSCANWHPLTWLSLEADSQFFGTSPAAYHVTNVIIHSLNVLLLYLFLYQATGSYRCSLLVAALFAVHPLRVESVVWISERKDVLSSFFGLTTLLFYVHYARKPGGLRYCAVFVSYTLSLLSKPMWVTLPELLLLLDYWPLCRTNMIASYAQEFGAANERHSQIEPQTAVHRFRLLILLVIEKVPLVGLSIVSCVITLSAQKNAIQSFDSIPPSARIANSIVAVLKYLCLTFWPINLAPFYPYIDQDRSWVVIVISTLLILAATITAVIFARRRPALIIGWFWFLGTLVPVIGIVQVGGQAYADRYTYLPHIGLFIAIVWLADSVAQRFSVPTWSQQLLCGAWLFGCVCLTWIQACYWLNSEVLWRHSLAVTRDHYIPIENMMGALIKEGKYREAEVFFPRALKAGPKSAITLNNIGSVLNGLGKSAEAIMYLERGLKYQPDHPLILNNLGVANARLGKLQDAANCFERAVELKPDVFEMRFNLANVLKDIGQPQRAIEHLQECLKKKPKSSVAYNLLGLTYLSMGRTEEAVNQLKTAAQLDPRNVTALFNLGATLTANGRHAEAIPVLKSLIVIQPGRSSNYAVLAMAEYEAGDRSDSRRHYQEALRLDPHWLSSTNRKAWALATNPDPRFRNGVQAIELASCICQATEFRKLEYLDTLAASYAEAGRFTDAVRIIDIALKLASDSATDPRAQASLNAHRKLYVENQPYHESAR